MKIKSINLLQGYSDDAVGTGFTAQVGINTDGTLTIIEVLYNGVPLLLKTSSIDFDEVEQVGFISGL